MGEQVQWILGEGVLQQEERAAPEIWSTDMGWGGSARPRTGEGCGGGEHHSAHPGIEVCTKFPGKGTQCLVGRGEGG